MLLTRPALLLRLEGPAAGALAILLYARQDTSWWWLLFLTPTCLPWDMS